MLYDKNKSVWQKISLHAGTNPIGLLMHQEKNFSILPLGSLTFFLYAAYGPPHSRGTGICKAYTNAAKQRLERILLCCQ